MGFPNFGKVKTITIPTPTNGEMSKEDYKNFFGIDFDSLNIYDLVLIKQDDDLVVPVLFHDKENKILYTANYAIDYSSTSIKLNNDSSLIQNVVATLPIGGTKLYLHYIHNEEAGFYLINTRATAYPTISTMAEVSSVSFTDVPTINAYIDSADHPGIIYRYPSPWDTGEGEPDCGLSFINQKYEFATIKDAVQWLNSILAITTSSISDTVTPL